MNSRLKHVNQLAKAAVFSAVVIYTTVLSIAADDDISLLKKTGKAFASVAKSATPAVVSVKVEMTVRNQGGYGQYNNQPYDLFGDELMRRFFPGRRNYESAPREYQQEGTGSGFIISEDGYILTNNHVVGDADKITVMLNDGRKFTARKIGSDPKSEVAVIKIDAKDLPFLKLGDSSKIEVGEWVIAIGSPFEFLTETVTVGVVSAKGRSLRIADYEDFIQTDAAINPGNSGGPLLNIDGEVIGINTAIYSQSGGYQGIGFAIPVNLAKVIKEQLVATGKVVRGYLGIYIQDVTSELADYFDLKKPRGIVITKVAENSPAEKAGLKRDDIVLEIDADAVESASSFRNRVASYPPGKEISLKILRNGKEEIVKAQSGTLPDEEGDMDNVSGHLGFSVEELTDEYARRFGYEAAEGVIINEVNNESNAAKLGIQPGDLVVALNRMLTPNMEAFKKAFGKIGDKKAVLLLIKSQYGRTYYLKLDIE